MNFAVTGCKNSTRLRRATINSPSIDTRQLGLWSLYWKQKSPQLPKAGLRIIPWCAPNPEKAVQVVLHMAHQDKTLLYGNCSKTIIIRFLWIGCEQRVTPSFVHLRFIHQGTNSVIQGLVHNAQSRVRCTVVVSTIQLTSFRRFATASLMCRQHSSQWITFQHRRKLVCWHSSARRTA